MRKGTLVLLLALFAVLGWLYLQREEAMAPEAVTPVQVPLLLGLAPERVSALRVENLERAIQVKLERDAGGAWFLTDPVAYPAIDTLVISLFETLRLSTGDFDELVDPAAVSLDPPLVVLEIVQLEPEGGESRLRLEVGAIDLDGSRVYVRVPDHPQAASDSSCVLRGPRTIYTTLDRNPDDFRDRRATHLRGKDVTAFRRSGSATITRPDGRVQEVDLELDALLETSGWRKFDPPVATLEPNAIGLVVRGAAELKADSFASDAPLSFAEWGLDPPAFTIHMTDRRGASTELHFGYPRTVGPSLGPPEQWFCRRAGFDHVWELDPADVALLTLPAEELYEELIVRARRDDILRVELEGGGRTLMLGREPRTEAWVVGERRSGDEEEREREVYPADAGRVSDVLAALEQTYLGGHYPDVDFVRSDPPRSILVVTGQGVRAGGELGQPFNDAETGAGGVLYRRFGDDVAALMHEDVAALCDLSLDDLRGRWIHRLLETQQRWVRLEHDGHALTYVQIKETVWHPEGQEIRAPKDFTNTLGTLLSLRVGRWLDEPGAVGELEDVLDVTVHAKDGTERSFRLGRTAAGVPVLVDGELAAELDFAQHVETWERDPLEMLLALFGE